MDKTRDIMQKVRRIEMQARRLAEATFAGEYRSGFRGQGLDFDDFREYMPGDEPRFIDWKVTARTGTPYVRKFHEEREQALLLAVDTSGSMHYAGSRSADTKLEYSARVAAVLAYSAALNGDKMGLLLFGRKPHFYLPPAKGVQQCLRIVREILNAPVGGEDEEVSAVVDEVLRTQRKKTLLVMLSDFLFAPDKQAIGKLNFRHELIPLRVNDPIELGLPAVGSVLVQDPESGRQVQVNLSDPAIIHSHSQVLSAHYADWDKLFNQLGVDHPALLTDTDFMPVLRRLFKRRSRLIVR